MGASGVVALLGALVLASRRRLRRPRPLGRRGLLPRFGVALGLFGAVAVVLALGAAARARRLLDGGQDSGVEHARAGDGPDTPAGASWRLRDDVHGDGPAGAAARRPARGQDRRARDRAPRAARCCVAAAAVFAARLPTCSRRGSSIIAQQMAAGRPRAAHPAGRGGGRLGESGRGAAGVSGRGRRDPPLPQDAAGRCGRVRSTR